MPEEADLAPGADSRLERTDTVRRVRAAIERLPPRQRDAIVLQTYQDLSNVEVAAAMGISVEALESLLSRGRRALRTMLGEDEA